MHLLSEAIFPSEEPVGCFTESDIFNAGFIEKSDSIETFSYSTEVSSQGFFLGTAVDLLGRLSCRIISNRRTTLLIGKTYIQFIRDDLVIWNLVDLS